MVSLSNHCVLDVVPAVSKLDNGIDEHVEFSEVCDLLFEVLASLGVSVKVSGFAEEVGTKTFVRVVEHTVLVSVVKGAGILDNELNLPDEVSLVALSGAGLLVLLVE